jgi:hypothetical protein
MSAQPHANPRNPLQQFARKIPGCARPVPAAPKPAAKPKPAPAREHREPPGVNR